MRAMVIGALFVVAIAAGCSSSSEQGAAARRSTAPAASPAAEQTPSKSGRRSGQKSDVLRLPIDITTTGETTYSTSRLAVDIRFTAPSGMAYPFAADIDSPTFVNLSSDDAGGVAFIAPRTFYSADGKLVAAPRDPLSWAKGNARISVADETRVRVGGVAATKATVAATSIPHEKWAYCGDTYCVPVIPLPNDSPYGLVKNVRYTYYFLTIHGHPLIVSIEGQKGSGFKTFFQEAARLVKTISFDSSD